MDQFAEFQDAPAEDKEPITEEGAPEGGDSIHIPAEFLQGAAAKFKPGDKVTMSVISADEDGIEVEYATEEVSSEGEGEMSANEEMDMMESKGGGY